MSDRVGYLVGNIVHRDHGYWPTITPAQLAFLGYPARTISCTLEQLMALSWRVKRWRFSGDLAGIAVAHNTISGCTQTTTGIFSYSHPPIDKATITGITRERDLIGTVCDYVIPGTGSEFYRFVGLRNAGIVSNFNTLATVSYDFSSIFSPGGCGSGGNSSGVLNNNPVQFGLEVFGNAHNKEYVVFDSGGFYPYFSGGGGTAILSSGSLNFSIQSSDANGTITVDFQDNTDDLILPVNVTGDVNFGAGWIQDSFTVTTCDLTLEAIEFWPYENSLHLPVWNTSTGAQLVDPFS